MELKQTDLTTRIHKESLLEKIKASESNIEKLFQWSLSTEQPLGWRATWMMKQLLRKNDPRLVPFVAPALDRFMEFNESQKREWLRTLLDQQISEDEEGKLFDLCINEWKKIHNHPALRSTAIQHLIKIIKKFPELKGELNHLMEAAYLESLSPAIKKSAMKQWQSLP